MCALMMTRKKNEKCECACVCVCVCVVCVCMCVDVCVCVYVYVCWLGKRGQRVKEKKQVQTTPSLPLRF